MYLIIGSSGQLGKTLKTKLNNKNAYFLTSKDIDITKKDSILSVLKKYKNISIIINCAAYTNVEKAEEEQLKATEVNVLGPGYLAETKLPIIHISTDYVFDGNKSTPYKENDITNPLNIYAKTKLDGENEIIKRTKNYIIIRTSWLYSEYEGNFLTTMLRLFDQKEELSIVEDQIGTPTYTGHLADFIIHILKNFDSTPKGIYHFSDGGETSWYKFAKFILEKSKKKCSLKTTLSKNYITKAARPKHSVLSKEKVKNILNYKIEKWEKGVEKCLKKLS